ncbi:MAG TPA: hypothetical protein VFR31_05585, partial [Thermoanaerobaculia bacterium]|nr:hypothetical protein [Thermoanaerobaculia bacterium]
MLKKVLLSTAAVLLAAALPAGAGVSIDRVSPSTGGGCGANPAQILNLVPPGGGCDVAGVGPVLEVMPPAFGLVANDNIDGLSSNTFTPETINYYLIFSGSRVSVGAAGTPYNAEAAANQAAADLWRTQITSGSPAAAMAACAAVVVPTPPHAQHRNQTAFNLVRTAAPGIAVANPIDNIDAVEMDVLDFTGDDVHDVDVYFSLDPASPNLVASGADIYFSPAGAGAFAVFAFPPSMGLLAGDNLDSLVMWDRGAL